MLRPDYQRSIVNLMSSIAAAFGGDPGLYPPLAELPPASLHDGPVVLWVVDGLGDELLARFPDSALARHRRARLTSVFPTTTASAITTFGTGRAPQQHAVTGWFMWLKELGSVVTTLPFVHRCDGQGLTHSGITPDQVIACRPLASRIGARSHVISPDYIVDSAYNRALAGPARRYGHTGLADLVDAVAAAARERRYVYAYWPALDSLSHEFGPDHPKVSAHFHAVDAAFADLHRRLAGRGATLLVSADHGQIAASEDRVVHLASHPRLAQCLALPLCGEPRAAFCYLRPARVRQFLDYVAGELGHCCTAHAGDEWIAQGLFGLGEPSPRLAERIGDYVLLMRDGWVIRDRLPGEKPFTQRGVHGGLAGAELYVPLVIARP